MSEVVTQTIAPEERVSRMRDLLGHALENGFADVEVLGGFIDYYEEHIKELDSNQITPFFEQLDFPDHDLMFGDGTFDDVAASYDALGGQPRPCEVEAKEPQTQRRLNDHQLLPHAEEQSTTVKLPAVVHAKLGQLVTELRYEGIKASQRDVITTLLVSNKLSPADLAAQIMRYRKTTVGEFLDQNPDLE
jgi:hypothetical protein